MKVQVFIGQIIAQCALALALSVPLTVGTGRAGAEPLSPVVDVAPPYGGYGRPDAANALAPDEIIASVRSAGFDPITRPMLRGPVYVLRAVDTSDADVRVTVDARSGRVLTVRRVAGLYYGAPDYSGYEPGPFAPRDRLPHERWRRDFGEYERAPIPPSPVPQYELRRGNGAPMYGQPESRNVAPEFRGESVTGSVGSGGVNSRSMAGLRNTQLLPLPRARPAQIAETAVKDAGSTPQGAPNVADPAATASSAPAGHSAPINGSPDDRPQPPAMVPIAPLE